MLSSTGRWLSSGRASNICPVQLPTGPHAPRQRFNVSFPHMGELKPASYYDEYYKVPRTINRWLPLWEWCLSAIKPLDRVLELGCGDGHLARRLPDCEDYLGVDFSHVAIHAARAKCSRTFMPFDVSESYPTILATFNPTITVATEFLEHIGNDIEVVEACAAVGDVVASVPKNDAPSHVRFFPDREAVERYSPDHVEEFPEHWCWIRKHV